MTRPRRLSGARRFSHFPALALLLGGLHLLAAAPAAAQATPSVPQNVRVTAGDGKLTLYWQAPSDWGAAVDRAFQVGVKPNAESVWRQVLKDGSRFDPAAADTSLVVTGLQLPGTYTITNGTAYDLRIRATATYRIQGTQLVTRRSSAWVTALNQVPAGPPARPARPSVTAGVERLDVSWTAPSTGGSAITGYDVHYRTWNAPASLGTGSDPSTGWIAASHAGTSTTAAITNLTGGEAYYSVRVRARNALGNGPWSIPEPLWSARLTVGGALGVAGLGCSSVNSASQNRCDVTSILSDGNFSFISSTDRQVILSVREIVAGNGLLFRTTATGANRDLFSTRQLSLCVGATAYAFSDAVAAGGNGFRWTGVDVGWSIGDEVILRVAGSCDAVTEPKTYRFAPWEYSGTPGGQARATVSLSEAAPAGGLELTLTQLFGTALPANLCTGTLADSDDIGSSAPTTVTVQEGKMEASFNYPLADNGDELVGGSECFALRLGTSAAGWTAGTNAVAKFTIELSFGRIAMGGSAGRTTKYEATVAETVSGGTLDVPVTVNHLPNSSTTFTVEVLTGGTATEYVDASNPGDFRIADKTVTFGPQTSKTQNVTVTITNDVEVEDGETIELGIVDAPNNDGTNNRWYRRNAQGKLATVTITSEDAVPDAVTGLVVSSDSARLDLSWNAPANPGSSAITGYDVHYTSADAQAVGNDAVAGTNAATEWVAVSRTGTTASDSIKGLTNDTDYRVRVRAANASGPGAWAFGAGTPARTPSVWLGVSPNPVAEGSGVTVTATLSKALGSRVRIPITVTAGSAESEDFFHLADLLLIEAGDLSNGGSGTHIQTYQDTDADDETFTVALGTLPSEVVAGSPSEIEVTITDDEKPSVSLAADPNPVTEGEAVTITATLTAALSDAVTIPVTLADGSAESGDYAKTLTGITVAAGRTTGTGTIQTNHDAGEDDETFTVALGSPLPAAVLSTSRSSVMVTISDDEGIPSVTLGASPNPVDEGETVTVTVTLSKPLASAVTIPLTLADGSAEPGDYARTLTSIGIVGGQTSATGTIRTNQDTDTDDETFTVALGTLPSVVRAGAATSVEVRIADDDKAAATLEASPNPVDEGSSVTVTARLDKALPDAVILPLVLSKGSAEDGDYGTLTSIRVAAGRRSGSGTISTVRDEDEDDETFTVALGSPLPSSVLAGDPSSVEVRIRDDGPLRAELTSSTLRPAEGRSARLTATLNHPAPAGGVRVRFFADGTGDNPAHPVTDFTLAPTGESQHTTAWIGIDEGERSAVGWLRVVDDDVPEDDEGILVSLQGSWTAESPELELTIPANDGGGSGPAAWIDAEPNPVPEGRDVTVRVWLTKALDADARIPLTVRRVSSEAGDHGTLHEVVIAAGELVGRGTISTMRDDDIDDEKFIVRLGRLPSGVRAGTASSVEIVIYDLDEPPRRAWLEVSPNPVDEGKPVTVTARLTEGLTRSVTIPIEVARRTSEEGDHGTLSRIRIAAGATSGTGRITTARDEDGDNETFIVRLGEDMPSGVEAGSPDSVEVVIVDEQGTPVAAVSLEAAPNPVGEGESVTVTATLDKALTRSVTIPVAVERGTSESGDHGSLSGIRIASGDTEGTGTITTRVDSDTDDETFSVKLRPSLPDGVLAGRPDSVEVVIVDEGAPTPAAVSLEAAPNPVPEGESVTVTATLDKALSSSVRIPVTVERGSSESGDHGSLSSIRIASGDTEGTGTVTTSVDDDIDDETFTVKLRSNLPAAVMAGSPSEVEVTIADRGGDAPGRVRSLRVTAGDGRLDLTWSAPSSGTVTAYEAYYKERGASEWTVVYEDGGNYADTKAEITNLDNGTAYDVRVRATNDYGVGPWATGSGTPRGPSSANDLTSLSVRVSKESDGTYSSVSLSPSFRASTTAYKVTAPAGTRWAKFRPRAASSAALILVHGEEVASGAESPAVGVSQGTVIWIAVIPADNSEAKEYSVTFSIPSASMDAARSATAAADAALAIVGTLSPEDAAGALLGERSLGGERLEALDRLGNANGRYDLGDLLAWIERCRTGGARCGTQPRTAPPASDAALPGAIGAGAAARRQRRRGSGGRSPKRRRTGMLAVLLAAALWSCDGAGVVDPPAAAVVPDPGYLAVEWTAPAGGPAAAGALVEIDGPGIGDARAPGLELYESDAGPGPRRFVIAGDMRDGTVLEFRVPDRRQAGLYSVRVVEVAGKDHRLLEADAYRTAIAND